MLLRSGRDLLCRIVLGLTLIAAGSLLPGCSRDRESDTKVGEARPRSTPIIVLGVDGLDWRVILPLLKEGRLPNLAGLMERGSYGYLDTFLPTYSPVVWTSVATGKDPHKHGIRHFAHRLPNGRVTLFNSSDRKTKAIWNILSDYEKTVSSIGWWMTYPVEEISGLMIAQTNTIDQLDTRAGKHVWKGTLLKGVAGQVYPTDRQNEMMEIVAQVNTSLPDSVKQVFGEFRFPLSLLGQRLWSNCQWAFRADATYLRIALKLTEERPLPDLTLVYFGGTDVAGHRFWRYMQPDIYRHRPTDEQIANFGGVIEDYYAYTDRAMGQILGSCGADVTVFVLSDHGMHPVNMEGRFDPDAPPANVNSGNHQDAPPGVFIAAGPGIRQSAVNKRPQDLSQPDLKSVGSVLDITPTLLAMMRIPVGKDMDGYVLSELFQEDVQIARQPAPIPTHDTAAFLARGQRQAPPHPSEEERLEQLRSLGYIGASEPEGTAGTTP